MQYFAIIAVAVVVLFLAVIVTNLAARSRYEHLFRDWQAEAQVKWQAEMERARKTAINQSRAVLGGRFTEQMVPFFPDFKYDPTEVRFIGSPIDMIVFPGLAQGDPQEIVILEVKSGKNPQLTAAQKKIRRLIEDGMVRWDEVHRCTDDAEEEER